VAESGAILTGDHGFRRYATVFNREQTDPASSTKSAVKVTLMLAAAGYTVWARPFRKAPLVHKLRLRLRFSGGNLSRSAYA